jgi:signal transduction histidine kinase/ActR/RegA family two-component response regulator
MNRAQYDALIAQFGQAALEARSMQVLVDRMPGRLAETLGENVDIGLCLRKPAETGKWVAISNPLIQDIDPDALLDRLKDGHAFSVQGSDPRAVPAAHINPSHATCAVVPLVDRGQATGALVAWATQPSGFDHDAMHLLRSTATLVAAFLQRRETEEQLAHSQRLESLGQLTGGIAHDFNNLLTVMSGCLQLIAAEPGTPAASNALIESALRAVRNGADLTDKLLSFARRRQLRPSAIDAPRLLRDIAMLLERTIGDAIRLRVDIAPGVPSAYADASQLDAALVNLALNARDAMPDGGEITFSVVERRVGAGRAPAELSPGNYVVYSVSDTGTGMPPEVAARAVEPFFSTKGTRGSGLGLSMVYGFVQQSGGGMTIRSTPGSGTCVELLLPIAHAEAARGAKGATAAPALPPGRALVVEDEDAVRDVAAAQLRSLGYDVVAVDGYDSALAVLDAQAHEIDVVFSDLMLGSGPDGLALADVVRQRWPRTPILITSGHPYGFALPPSSGIEMLAKPYDRERLAAALAACRSRLPSASTAG